MNIYTKINEKLIKWSWNGDDHVKAIKAANNFVEEKYNKKTVVLAVIK